MNATWIYAALQILDLWYTSAERNRFSKSKISRRASIRWRMIGLINHDRILNGRHGEIITSFSKVR
jgi:hypothetical protein